MNQTKQQRIEQLERHLKSSDEQLTKASEDLIRTTALVQTMDGEIGRLTALNDRMFAIIDKLVTQRPI